MSAQNVRYVLVGVLVVAALALIVVRGGLIAWIVCLVGLGLVAKMRFKPGANDFGIACALGGLALAGWLGAYFYVMSTWESGEVVELVIDTQAGPHHARLWVLDIDAEEVVYYEADPHIAESLLAGKPVTFTRRGQSTQRVPQARRVSSLPAAEGARILAVMDDKYAEQSAAAVVYHVLLGSPRARIPVVATLVE